MGIIWIQDIVSYNARKILSMQSITMDSNRLLKSVLMSAHKLLGEKLPITPVLRPQPNVSLIATNMLTTTHGLVLRKELVRKEDIQMT
jgi:hypothetical protein